MKLLLDTHAFLWLMDAPDKLSSAARSACDDPDNTLLLSVVCLWEIQIKHQRRNLALKIPLEQIVREQTEQEVVELLSVEARHVIELRELPLHHHDPFDRLLLAQARVEDAALVSTDRAFAAYAEHAQILW